MIDFVGIHKVRVLWELAGEKREDEFQDVDVRIHRDTLEIRGGVGVMLAVYAPGKWNRLLTVPRETEG